MFFKGDAISTARKYLGEQSLKLLRSSPPSSKSCGVRVVSMVHKRGRKHPKSKEFWSQHKESYQFVRDQAFHDRFNGESICLNTVDDVAFHLALKFGEPVAVAVPDVEHGLVISDANGKGAFQSVDPTALEQE